ncbi:MAG: YbgA family protein [Vicinamibacterales bacterium]
MKARTFESGPRPRIGISSCLLGQKVRFDGGHKRDAFLVETFGQFIEWVAVCPEVELGLGTPRETLRLVRRDSGIRMVNNKTGDDISDAMRAWADRRVAALSKMDLSGYVLKKDSPSCGMERVKVYGDAPGSMPARSGRGLFAEILMARLPDLPVEEEGRLQDPRLRENFVERVFAYVRLKAFFAGRWTVGGLVEFHTAHKLTLLAHSPEMYRELGHLVAGAKGMERPDLERRYRGGFMRALSLIATARKHANVLMHIAGYFKRTLDAASRQELLSSIEDYRRGLVPLIVPLTLVRHHVRRTGEGYLRGQVYLDPHPKELMLRNHV